MRGAAANLSWQLGSGFCRWSGRRLFAGSGLEGDGLSGRAPQLADEVALAVPAVAACLVVAVAEVVVAGVGVGRLWTAHKCA